MSTPAAGGEPDTVCVLLPPARTVAADMQTESVSCDELEEGE